MADQEGYSSEGCGRCGDIQPLKDEIERLRAALKVARTYMNSGPDAAYDIVDAALNEQTARNTHD